MARPEGRRDKGGDQILFPKLRFCIASSIARSSGIFGVYAGKRLSSQCLPSVHSVCHAGFYHVLPVCLNTFPAWEVVIRPVVMVAQRIAGMEAYHRPKMFIIYLARRDQGISSGCTHEVTRVHLLPLA
ncbi:MAG: hypothetical protein ACLTMG_05875 [Oscillospiraceae bacterium]